MSDFPPVTRRQLLELARRAAARAYCPYSRFHVGAALVGPGGRLFTGANVENASYGLTNCAERTALFAAASAGLRRLRIIALTCPDAPADAPAIFRMPCGACRQVIAEFAAPDLDIVIEGVGTLTLEQVLPSAFVLPTERPPLDIGRPRVAVRGDAPAELRRHFDIGEHDSFALITADLDEATAAALAGRHAVTFGPGGEFVHGCATWDDAVALLRLLSG